MVVHEISVTMETGKENYSDTLGLYCNSVTYAKQVIPVVSFGFGLLLYVVSVL